nr:murein biosynthesis integral membrane protein MurJ [Thermoleophilaceae bacterium]
MSEESKPSSHVLAASGTMAVGTLFSRLTGFLRASMLAAAIGLALQGEVFNVANTIPNSLYILVAGGVFNTVLVPQLVRAIKNDVDGGDAYANRIVTLGAVVLAGVTAILVLAAPLLLRLMVDGSFFTDPALEQERESLIDFARWCLPQIFFYGMFVLVGQILNARGRFGPMMWAPIVNNLISIAMIATYLVLYADVPAGGGYTTSQEVLLGLGSTVGIAAQLLVLLPYLKASGFKISPRFDFRGTGLGHTLRLGMWTVGFVIVNQLAFYVMVRLATSGVAEGATTGGGGSGYTVYANAFLLTQVPHSIVTVSLATATIPLISRLAADGRLADVSSEMNNTLRLVLAVIVPFAVSLVVLGPALATIMFSWGQARGDTGALGNTLIAFAPGLLM